MGRQSDRRHVRARFSQAHEAHEFVPIHLRHLDVADDHIERTARRKSLSRTLRAVEECRNLSSLSRGAAPQATQQLAGHTTLTMTPRDMHLAPAAHR
jgi:hypothetical protein